MVFERLIQVLVFGCAYWRIADEQWSATTLRRRRDEWIEAGTMEALQELVLGSRLELDPEEALQIAVEAQHAARQERHQRA